MGKTNKRYRRDNQIRERHMSVFLSHEEDIPTKFFCVYCRNPICVHTRRVIALLPKVQPFPLPMSIKCSNRNCGATYHFFSI